jgi:hypothetical protein
MWWNGIAGMVQGSVHGELTQAQTRINNRLSVVNADAKNRTRQASNTAQAAQGNLARWVQSVNNNRALRAGGEALEQTIVNAKRADDADLAQGFAASIRSAEAQGMAAASQARAGVNGQVVDMVNASVALRDSIVRQRFADHVDTKSYDTARRAASIMSQTIGGLDSSVILETMDYNKDVAQTQHVQSRFANAITGMFEGMGMTGAKNSAQGQASDQEKQRTKMKEEWDDNMQSMKQGWWNTDRQEPKNQIKFEWSNKEDGIRLSDQIGGTMTDDDYAKAWWSSN